MNAINSKSEYNKRLEQLRQLTTVAKQSAGSDEYLRGMFNGMEFCLSVLEGREPKYEESSRIAEQPEEETGMWCRMCGGACDLKNCGMEQP